MLIHDIPDSALAIYAHPDDPEISCGGTLARWRAEGARIGILVTTLGDKGSQDPDEDLIALAERRRQETAESLGVLGGGEAFHLDFHDGELENTLEVRRQIVEVVRTFRPEVVFCPDPTAVFLFWDRYYNHRDHRTTGFAALDSVAPAAGNPHFFPEQLASGLEVHHVARVMLSGSPDETAYVDITGHLSTKMDALFCHASQLEGRDEFFRTMLPMRARETGERAGVEEAEGFRVLWFG